MTEPKKRVSPTQKLQAELESTKESLNIARGIVLELREQLKKFQKEEESKQNFMVESYRKHEAEMFDGLQKMMEIVRWHVNPETAKEVGEPCPKCQFLNKGNPQNCRQCGFDLFYGHSRRY